MIPCYVAGKGMYATETTWDFKVTVMEHLERTGLGFDTRFRYYQERLPKKSVDALARLVCDPIEYYDPDWPNYYSAKKNEGKDKDQLVTEYMLDLDARFRRKAKAAIVCFDEAGFGTGINTMRFIHDGKPVLGFYNPAIRKRDVNLSNILQLQVEFPFVVTLKRYDSPDEIRAAVSAWLADLSQQFTV